MFLKAILLLMNDLKKDIFYTKKKYNRIIDETGIVEI